MHARWLCWLAGYDHCLYCGCLPAGIVGFISMLAGRQTMLHMLAGNAGYAEILCWLFLSGYAFWIYCLRWMSMIPMLSSMLDMLAGYAAFVRSGYTGYSDRLWWLLWLDVLSMIPGNSGCICWLAMLALLDGSRDYDG